MPLPPDYDCGRVSAAPDATVASPVGAVAQLGAGMLLLLGYLALIPGFLPAFILAAVVGFALMVPVLLVAAASSVLVLPILAVRRLMHRPTRLPLAPDGADAALSNWMKEQIWEIRGLPETLPTPPAAPEE
jgi:hypothetical protein